MRISLEEEKARQEAEAAKQGGSGDDKAQGESSSSGGDKMAVDSKPTTSQGEPAAAHDTEDAELQAALAMSMQDKQGSGAQVNVFIGNTTHHLLTSEDQIGRGCAYGRLE